MGRQSAETALPPDLLRRASLAGNEYAWAVDDIPNVIEAARAANLISGGQLQFRLPGGGICECYWIEVDTHRSVDPGLSWQLRVKLSAEVAKRDFDALLSHVDFIAEGRKAFSEHLDKAVVEEQELADSICFVWDVLSEEEAAKRSL